MFRAVLLVLGGVLLIAASGAAFAERHAGWPVGWPMIPLVVFGALLVFGLLFERYVYKPIRTHAPGSGWQRTAEQFTDPGSGQSVTVYFNPRTGERRYVADGNR
jgi:uncharacterized iron-regulated membrane protein